MVVQEEHGMKSAFVATALLLLLVSSAALAAAPGGAQAPAPAPAAATAGVAVEPAVRAALDEIVESSRLQLTSLTPRYPRSWICSISCSPCIRLGAACDSGGGHCATACN